MKYFREKAPWLRTSLSQAFAAWCMKPSGRTRRGLRASLCLSLALLIPLATAGAVYADSASFAPVPYPFTDSLSRETSQVPDEMLPDSYTVLDKAGTEVLLNQSPGGGPDNDWVNGSLGALSALPDDMTGITFYYDLTASTNTGENYPYESNFCVLADGKRISLYDQVRLTTHFRVSSGAYVKETRNEWNARFAAQTSGYCVLSITKADLEALLTANGVGPDSKMVFAADEYTWSYGKDLANTVAKARDFGVLCGDSAMDELEEVYTAARNQSLNYVVTQPNLYTRSDSGGFGSVKDVLTGTAVAYGQIFTNLNNTSTPADAEAIVIYYDTTAYSSETDFYFINSGIFWWDIYSPIYSTGWNNTGVSASFYGLNTAGTGISGGVLTPLVTDVVQSNGDGQYRLPAKAYGYKIIPAAAFQSGIQTDNSARVTHYLGARDTTGLVDGDAFLYGTVGYVLDLAAFQAQLAEELEASKTRIAESKNKIDAIGEVTPDSEAAIRAARAAYDALDAGVLPTYGNTPEKNLVGEAYKTLLEQKEAHFAAIQEKIDAMDTFFIAHDATIKLQTDASNQDLRFFFETGTIPDGVTVTDYGAVMLPNAMLNGGELTLSTPKVAVARPKESGPYLIGNTTISADLNGSGNPMNPRMCGTKIAARAFVKYKISGFEKEFIAYSNNPVKDYNGETIGTTVRSVYGIADRAYEAIAAYVVSGGQTQVVPTAVIADTQLPYTSYASVDILEFVVKNEAIIKMIS